MTIIQISLIIVVAACGILEIASKQLSDRLIGTSLLIIALLAAFFGERI